MLKPTSVIEVRIDLDPIPGWGNMPSDHVMLLTEFLNRSIPHYNPKVTLIKIEEA